MSGLARTMSVYFLQRHVWTLTRTMSVLHGQCLDSPEQCLFISCKDMSGLSPEQCLSCMDNVWTRQNNVCLFLARTCLDSHQNNVCLAWTMSGLARTMSVYFLQGHVWTLT